MSDQEAARALLLVCVGAICSTLAWRIFMVCLLDRFRQAVFEMRDALFLDAAQGQIRFDDPVYLALRRRMNGFLRLANRISALRLLVLWIFAFRFMDDPDEEIFAKGIKKLTPVMRRQVRAYQERLQSEMFLYVVMRSPTTWLPVAVLFVYVLLRAIARGRTPRRADLVHSRAVAPRVREIDRIASAEGRRGFSAPLAHAS